MDRRLFPGSQRRHFRPINEDDVQFRYFSKFQNRMINPDGVRNQVEGNIIQGVSRALLGEVTFDANGVTSLDWATYETAVVGTDDALNTYLAGLPVDLYIRDCGDVGIRALRERYATALGDVGPEPVVSVIGPYRRRL
jgi:Molybdopterin-binding domain of aldehyde dehydrogenase